MEQNFTFSRESINYAIPTQCIPFDKLINQFFLSAYCLNKYVFNTMINKKLGYYTCAGKEFESKIQAAIDTQFSNIQNTECSEDMVKEYIDSFDGHSADKMINEIEFPKKTALVLGSEAAGMRNITKNLCDEVFKIGINKNLESLNVSNAAAITFFYLNNR